MFYYNNWLYEKKTDWKRKILQQFWFTMLNWIEFVGVFFLCVLLRKPKTTTEKIITNKRINRSQLRIYSMNMKKKNKEIYIHSADGIAETEKKNNRNTCALNR